jgi:hypothetical protein
MTVKELIDKLSKVDPETRVYISGSSAMTDAKWPWHFRVQPYGIIIG